MYPFHSSFTPNHPFADQVGTIISGFNNRPSLHHVVTWPGVTAGLRYAILPVQSNFRTEVFLGSIRFNILTHRGRVTHICVSKLIIIGSDNGLSPGGGQAIIGTNDGSFLIRTLGTNFSEIANEIHTFSVKKMHFKSRLRNGGNFASASN